MIKVHVIHVSHVIITYILESLSSLTQITPNLHIAINLEKWIIKEHKSEGIHLVDLSLERMILLQFRKYSSYLTSSRLNKSHILQ